MGFPKQECWSELPFPSPGDLSDPEIEPWSSVVQVVSCTAGGFFTNWTTREAPPVRKAFTKKARNNMCWYGFGEKGTFDHCCLESKLVQPLWRLVRSFLKILKIELPSVQFSCSGMSDSLQLHELQHARPPCPSPTPRAYPSSCPLSRWYHPTISSSVIHVSSCSQSFPASGSFQMSQLFTSGGQSIGVSASTSVLPMNTQDWSPLGPYHSAILLLDTDHKYISWYLC